MSLTWDYRAVWIHSVDYADLKSHLFRWLHLHFKLCSRHLSDLPEEETLKIRKKSSSLLFLWCEYLVCKYFSSFSTQTENTVWFSISNMHAATIFVQKAILVVIDQNLQHNTNLLQYIWGHCQSSSVLETARSSQRLDNWELVAGFGKCQLKSHTHCNTGDNTAMFRQQQHILQTFKMMDNPLQCLGNYKAVTQYRECIYAEYRMVCPLQTHCSIWSAERSLQY